MEEAKGEAAAGESVVLAPSLAAASPSPPINIIPSGPDLSIPAGGAAVSHSVHHDVGEKDRAANEVDAQMEQRRGLEEVDGKAHTKEEEIHLEGEEDTSVALVNALAVSGLVGKQQDGKEEGKGSRKKRKREREKRKAPTVLYHPCIKLESFLCHLPTSFISLIERIFFSSPLVDFATFVL